MRVKPCSNKEINDVLLIVNSLDFSVIALEGSHVPLILAIDLLTLLIFLSFLSMKSFNSCRE